MCDVPMVMLAGGASKTGGASAAGAWEDSIRTVRYYVSTVHRDGASSLRVLKYVLLYYVLL